ncbi:F-box domain [Arabidopsis thaliana x Arabidopsis arenosa]|uniref:F-box domain n=1 Tax=Arabidopsis thaliana x Arabidopsis arenosa TaxID=1240361 RepID=A0A8T1XSG2_9BRAS|nr:F-box domain [Arabidopsis thaliana x Arabidopsis arenosa]
MQRGRQEKKSSRSPKRQHHSEISDIEKSNGIHIPFDLITDILSRLPVKSLVRFQCVSKQWSSRITVSIMTRSLFSPSTYPTNDISFIYPDKHISYTLNRGRSWDFEYQYIRGLFCGWSSSIYEHTKRETILLPEVKYDRWSNSCDGLFGYDPVEKQVFTLVGGPMKQQWRNLDLQGIWNHSPEARSTGLCINEFIYYIAHVERDDSEFYELVRFDVRHERFDRIQMPITLQMNQLSEVSFDELTLVNYQGKLGCIRYTKASAEMWIMEDHIEKQEWSKIIIFKSLEDSYCIAGVNPNGEIVIMPKTVISGGSFDVCYYDPKQNKSCYPYYIIREGN